MQMRHFLLTFKGKGPNCSRVTRNTKTFFPKSFLKFYLKKKKVFSSQYQANIPMTKWNYAKPDSSGIKQAI